MKVPQRLSGCPVDLALPTLSTWTALPYSDGSRQTSPCRPYLVTLWQQSRCTRVRNTRTMGPMGAHRSAMGPIGNHDSEDRRHATSTNHSIKHMFGQL